MPNLFSASPVVILAWVCAPTSGLIRNETRGDFVFFASQLVDDFQFRYAFHVEVGYTGIQAYIDFPVAFSYAGKHDFLRRESGVQTGFDFSAAYAVGSESSRTDDAQQFAVGIGFYGIMYMIIIVFARFCLDGIQCFTEQLRVVIIERCSYRIEFFYRK